MLNLLFVYFRTRWGKMSHCLGSYCYIKVGATISDVETLMEPVIDSHTDKVSRVMVKK